MAAELIRDQYSGRYPFELLQNANDAAVVRHGDGARTLSVRFVLTDSALVVADMGSGFGPEEVEALCTLGNSSKDPRKTIGYKGIGFKSVGEITERPQVVSASLRFSFDAEKVRHLVEDIAGPLDADQRLPVYAFPFALEAADLGSDAELVAELESEGFVTIIRLPFRDDVDRQKVAEDLSVITPHLLLFLDGTDRLEVLGGAESFTANCVGERREGRSELLLEIDGADPDEWSLFEKTLSIPEVSMVDRIGDKWRLVREVHVAAAFRLENGVPSLGGLNQRLHVYFPTQEETGLPFVVHGDFALDLDRSRVTSKPEASDYNDWLVTSLGTFLAEVAAELADRFDGDPRIVAALAPTGTPTGFGARVSDRYRDAMRHARFIPTTHGEVRAAGDVCLLPDSIPDVHGAHRMLDLRLFAGLTLPGVDAVAVSRAFVKSLGAEDLIVAEVIRRITEPTCDEDLAALYRFLVGWNHADPSVVRNLADVRCVRTVSGGWVEPSGRVYFPRERGAPALPEGLPFDIAHVPESDDDDLIELLSDAGVKPFRWRDIALFAVIPVLADADAPAELRAHAHEALRLYFESEGGGDREIQDRAGRSLVLARRATEEEPVLREASRTYFASAWLDSDRLERIYGPFDEPEFLALEPPQDPEEADLQRGYLTWLGVAARPRVLEARAPDQNAYRLSALDRHPHRGLSETYWREAPFTEARLCDQDHRLNYQQLERSYALDRFRELVTTKDAARLTDLFAELAESWGDYASAVRASLRCHHGWHGGDPRRTTDSLLLHALRSEEWVPAVREARLVLAKPDRVWTLGRAVPHRVAAYLSALPSDQDRQEHAAFFAAIGLVDAARATADDLLHVLVDLSTSWPEGDDPGERAGLVEAVRWVMRELNSALEAGDTTDLEGVLLLAGTPNGHEWVERPYFTDDSAIERVWAETVPILDADRTLNRLWKAFDLPDLADQLVMPRADGIDDEASAGIRAHIGSAAPLLAAIAVDTQPSRADSIRARLAALKVVACRELVLEHSLDGHEITSREYKAYVDTVLEGEGVGRRMVGTAYLELDENGLPDWYALGLSLAHLVEVSTQRDAFALILSSGTQGREQFLRARGIDLSMVDVERDHLASPPEDEEGVVYLGRPEVVAAVVPEPVTEEPEEQTEASEEGTSTNGGPASSPGGSAQGQQRGSSSGAAAGGVGGGTSTGTGKKPRRDGAPDEKRGAWLVQVSGSTSDGADGEGSPERSEHDRRVDEAGVKRVLEYERAAGREPREMEHHNPGYDVESFEIGGQKVARYIEVKATGTDWTNARPIPISDTQFEMAAQLGELYWLYVVERAEAEDFEIYPICDPAQRATEFRFDPGWKKAAEKDEPIGSSPTPELPDVSHVVFGTESRDEGDVPFLEWTELDKVGRDDLEGEASQWFTSPTTTEAGDFALQQRDNAMGMTLPFGAIAVFRPADGAVESGTVVLADVANESADPRLAVRRAQLIRSDDGELQALALVCDVPGTGEDFAFEDSYAAGRIRAVLVAHQEL